MNILIIPKWNRFLLHLTYIYTYMYKYKCILDIDVFCAIILSWEHCICMFRESIALKLMLMVTLFVWFHFFDEDCFDGRGRMLISSTTFDDRIIDELTLFHVKLRTFPIPVSRITSRVPWKKDNTSNRDVEKEFVHSTCLVAQDAEHVENDVLENFVNCNHPRLVDIF